MADLVGTFVDDSGQTRLDGTLKVPAGVSADSVNGVAVNNTPATEGLVLTTVDGTNCNWLEVISTDTAPPVAYATPLVFDTTAVTGGLYAWDGTAYVQVGGPI